MTRAPSRPHVGAHHRLVIRPVGAGFALFVVPARRQVDLHERAANLAPLTELGGHEGVEVERFPRRVDLLRCQCHGQAGRGEHRQQGDQVGPSDCTEASASLHVVDSILIARRA